MKFRCTHGEKIPNTLSSFFARSCILLTLVSALKAESAVSTPHRVVTLSPSLTEIVLDILPGNRKNQLVGVSSFSDYPKEVENIEKVGSYVNPKIEKIVSLKPTVILATKRGNPKEKVYKLEKLGKKVVLFHIQTLDDLAQAYKEIGDLIGEKESAQRKSQLILKRKKEVLNISSQFTKRPKVYYQVGNNPAYTINSETFTSHLIEIAGGVNIFSSHSTRYPRPKKESIISKKPDLIFLSDFHNNNEQLDKTEELWEKLGIDSKILEVSVYRANSSITDRTGSRALAALNFFHEKIKAAAEKAQ